MTRARRHWDASTGAPVAVLAGGVLSGLGGELAGRPGALPAAALAVVVVVVFFWSGALPVLVVGGQPSRAGVGFLLLLMGYVLRLAAVVLALAAASRSAYVDARWLALTLIALTFVWVTAQVALLSRSRRTLEV